MLAISVRFLHGTFRADSEDVAITGEEPRGEWPPSPARLFSALVAGGGTDDRCRLGDDAVLRQLERARPPIIYSDERTDVLRSRLTERYVVVDETRKGMIQEYPARSARPVRPGVRMAPRDPRVLYVWEDVALDRGALDVLAARAAQVGYLGCADSPVTVRIEDPVALGDRPEKRWVPDRSGSDSLPVPYEGFLDVLDDMYGRFCAGEIVRRSWFASRRVRYRPPGPDPAEDKRQTPIVIWLRIEPAVSGRKVLAVTQALRDAVLEKYERHVAGSSDEVPQVLHGHGFDGTGYQHACWLALPDVGHPYSRGKIHGAAIWLPPGTPTEVVQGVHTALWHVQELGRSGYFRVHVSPFSEEKKPLAARPDRWNATERVWASAFPVVHEHWQKGGPDLAEVKRWCLHAGLPEPVGFRSVEVPLLPGAVSLMPHEARRKGKEFRPYSHIELIFAEPVTGPVVIGRSRQFGLGLMAPRPEPFHSGGGE